MRRALWLLPVLAIACASAEMPSGDHDPANPSATVAALDVGAGVLSSSFSPDATATPAGADDPHAGHHMSAAAAESGVSGAPRAMPKKSARPATPTTYTCMHHPEVVSTVKGQCPKCGMDLVPQQPPAGAAQP